mgnify:CR=1 FL=1
MGELKFKGLHRKMLFLVLLVTFILVFMASVVLYMVEYHGSVKQTEVQLNQLISTIEQTASIAAYSNNEQIATEVLEGLLVNDNVYGAEIKSLGGFSLSQFKSTSHDFENKVLRLLYSPFGDGQVVGQLVVQWPDRLNHKAAERQVISNLLISIGLIGVTAIVIFLLIRTYITQPLTLASNNLHAVRNGDAGRIEVLKRNSNDELGRLIADTNKLLEALDDKFNTEHELRIEVELIEKQLRHAYDASSAGLFLLDEAGVVQGYNSTLPAILRLQESASDLLVGASSFSDFFIEPYQFDGLLAKAFLSEGLESQDFQVTSEKGAVWVHCLMSKVLGAQGGVLIEGVLFDVSERVITEQAIKHEVMHDALTELLRKSAAQVIFTEYVASNTEKNSVCALMLDLDGFKLANDTYGHLAGDEVLKVVAKRLLNCVRSTDIVCRLGGDEFLVVLLNAHSEAFKLEIADKIVRLIQQPILVKGQIMINIGVSVGVADFDAEEDCSFDCLLGKADQTMYAVKRAGKNGYAFTEQNGALKIVRI